MAKRDEFLTRVWEQIINAPMSERWIESYVAHAKANPNAPFADAGMALQKLLASGAGRRDLSLAARAMVYEAVFSLLYELGEAGLDGEEGSMLHESLLSADPSGLEGRPGSAP